MNNSRAASWRGLISRWGLAVLMMVVIFTASSFPSRDLPNFGLWDRLVKKGGHMLGFALLAVAYARGLAGEARPTRRQLLMAVVLAGLYAITDEFHQLFVAGRGATATDVLIDTVGASLGVGVWEWGREWMRK
jgi:VanZ family protein